MRESCNVWIAPVVRCGEPSVMWLDESGDDDSERLLSSLCVCDAKLTNRE